MYYWLESSDRWVGQGLADLEWTDQSATKCVLPVDYINQAGKAPDFGRFIVKSNPDSFSWVTSPTASRTVGSQRRGDGVDGDMAYPAFVSGTSCLPFTLCRIRSSADSGRADPTTCLVGAAIGFVNDLASDDWLVNFVELPRWAMSGAVIRNYPFRAPDVADSICVSSGIACFNEQGAADQCKHGDGTPLYAFCSPNMRSLDGTTYGAGDYGGYWLLGDVMNCLRDMFIVNPGKYGTRNLAPVLNWPEAGTEAAWPFLCDEDQSNCLIMDLALGGLPLSEALDIIVRKAGNYEWRCVWNDGDEKWDLHIYEKTDGDTELDPYVVGMTRGYLRADLNSAPPHQIVAGTVSYNYSDCATEAHAIGPKVLWETTVGYGSMVEYGCSDDEILLEPAWTDAEQLSYELAERTFNDAADSTFPDVFRRFKFKDAADWETLLGFVTPTGERPIMPILATQDAGSEGDASRRVMRVRVWRKTNSGLEEAPATVNVSVNQDATITISGYRDRDPQLNVDPAPRTKRMRYLCNWHAPAEEAWEIHPFRVTIVVEDPVRQGAAEYDKPANWPDREAVVRVKGVESTRRYKALHGVGDGTIPAANNYEDIVYKDQEDPVWLRSAAGTLGRVASATIAALAKPLVGGELIVDDLDTEVQPGCVLQSITGGSVDEADPKLPTLYVYGIVRSVEHRNLSIGGNQQSVVTVEGS